jgi:hypothetical protein
VLAKTAIRLQVTKQQHQQLKALQKHQGDRETTIQILLAGERHQGTTRAGTHLLVMLVGAASCVSTMIGTLRAMNHGGVAIRTTNHDEVAQTTLGGPIIVKIMAAACHQDHRQEGSLNEEYANIIMRMATAGRGHLAITFTVDLLIGNTS